MLVILPIKAYEELLDQAEDAEAVAWLKKARTKPLHYRALNEYLAVQFEGYVPTEPKLKHRYDSLRHVAIGGLDFYVDTWVGANDDKVTAGSDTEHIKALIRAHGYKMPAGMMYVRFVHLLNEQKRKELMIIYGEDLAPTGLTAADLHKGGRSYGEWPAIEKGLVARAANKIAVEESANP